jgi:hypothetical protein
MNHTWDDDPDESFDTAPTWVRWTVGIAFITMAVALLLPYEWWNQLAVLGGLVVAQRFRNEA